MIMGDEEKINDQTKWGVFQICINTVNHMFIGFVTIFIILVTINGLDYRINKTLMVHVLLCTIGYQLLMAEAMIILYPFNVWSSMAQWRTKSVLHIAIQTIAAVISIVGMVIIIVDKERNLFKSTHGLAGLISLVFLVIAALIGILAMYSKKLIPEKPTVVKFFHNIMSVLAFLTGMISLIGSFNMGFFGLLEPSSTTQTALQVISSLTVIFTLYGPLITMYEQLKDMFGC